MPSPGYRSFSEDSAVQRRRGERLSGVLLKSAKEQREAGLMPRARRELDWILGIGVGLADDAIAAVV